MKFKVFPEDFQIEEVLKKGVIKNKGKYKVFLLRKRNIDTFGVKNTIEKTFKVRISFAGLKDKNSISYQYFCVKNGELPSYIKGNNFRAEFIGFCDNILKGSDIEKNRFKVTIRDIKKEERDKIERELEFLFKEGFPNYFDLQRVSYERREFFFNFVLKNDLKNALKIHFLSLPAEKRKNLRRFKDKVKKDFNDIYSLLAYAPSNTEREILKLILKKEFRKALLKIPYYMLRIYFEKFMSFLWNKASSNFLRRKIISKRKGFSLKTPYSYLFIPSKIRENIKEILTKDLFSVPGTSFPPCYPEFELYLKREFEKLSLSFPPHLPDFLEPDKFKGYKRTLWVNTSETQYSFEQDKLFLSFSLSPGSYATLFLKILIKRVSLSH